VKNGTNSSSTCEERLSSAPCCPLRFVCCGLSLRDVADPNGSHLAFSIASRGSKLAEPTTGPRHAPELSPTQRIELIDVYKTTFDTWRSQVDSYWQRSNYFALFETAAIGGCWHLVSGQHALAGVGLSLLGIALTVVWYRNNTKTHAYVRHWWDALMAIESHLHLGPNDFATQLERKQEERHKSEGDTAYRRLIQQVPILFGVAWTALLFVGVIRAASFACNYLAVASH
jgi:hypothetical protein